MNDTLHHDHNEHEHHGHDCGPNCEHHHEHHHAHDEELSLDGILPEDLEEYTITMADEETGEEFTFYMADDFEYEGQVYVVLLSVDDDPEAVFAKVVDMEDGSEGFETLDDEEFERVSDYYVELCEQEQGEFDDLDEVEVVEESEEIEE